MYHNSAKNERHRFFLSCCPIETEIKVCLSSLYKAYTVRDYCLKIMLDSFIFDFSKYFVKLLVLFPRLVYLFQIKKVTILKQPWKSIILLQ